MTHKFGDTIVVALGGSVVYPEAIDVPFLKKFRKFVLQYTKQGKKFVIVVGGGRLARFFQTAAHAVTPLTDEDKDWIGIHSTRLNGQLLRTIFRDVADPVIMDARGKMKKLSAKGGSLPAGQAGASGGNYPVTIAAGWRPGWSTDFVAAAIASDFKIPDYIVVGKPSHVYDRDPHKYKNTKPFDEISWREYRKLIPAVWVPGSHAPVDPVAAKLSAEKKLTAIVLDGGDLKNLGNLLAGKNFIGTIIQHS
jgi:uridylate kinase